MLLAGSNKPTDALLSTFISALKKEGDVVSLKKFIQVSFPLFNPILDKRLVR